MRLNRDSVSALKRRALLERGSRRNMLRMPGTTPSKVGPSNGGLPEQGLGEREGRRLRSDASGNGSVSRSVTVEPSDAKTANVQTAESAEAFLEPRILIPRPEAECPAGHRNCPTAPSGSLSGLTRQIIPDSICEGRQKDAYHKCAACVHFCGTSFAGSELLGLQNSPSHFAALRNGERQSPETPRPETRQA